MESALRSLPKRCLRNIFLIEAAILKNKMAAVNRSLLGSYIDNLEKNRNVHFDWCLMDLATFL